MKPDRSKLRRRHTRRDAASAVAPNLPAQAGLRGMVVPINALACNPVNVRKHSEQNLQAIKASLRQFGQQKPIVVGSEGVVIAGNGTLEAAKQLGWTHIAAVESELTGKDRMAYAVADNRTAELAEWDSGALAQHLKEIGDIEAGFSRDAIAKLMRSVESAAAEQPDIPECFQVVIECDSEQHQKRLYERLTAEGLKCRLLVL